MENKKLYKIVSGVTHTTGHRYIPTTLQGSQGFATLTGWYRLHVHVADVFQKNEYRNIM